MSNDQTHRSPGLGRLENRLEEIFLRLLRLVVLLVLLISLVGSLIFCILSFTNKYSSPSDYKFSQSDTESSLQEFKDSLNKGIKKDTLTNQKDNAGIQDEIEAEIDKQLFLVRDFLARYGESLTNEAKFRAGLLERAQTLSAPPNKEKEILEYAKSQSQFLQLALTDKDILDFFDSHSKDNREDTELFDSAYYDLLNFIPDHFREQHKMQSKSEEAELKRVIANKALSPIYLTIAGGMFLTFLLISLILVLIKIERNLRIKTI